MALYKMGMPEVHLNSRREKLKRRLRYGLPELGVFHVSA